MVRRFYFVTVVLLCIFLCGCGANTDSRLEEKDGGVTSSVTPSATVSPSAPAQRVSFSTEIEQIYLDGCGFLSDRKLAVETFVRLLGEAGYTAVDTENRLDMTCPEILQSFISEAQSGGNAVARVIVAPYLDGYSIYTFSASNRTVHVMQSYYSKQGERMAETERYEYDAEYFSYTEEGYLMIQGEWHLEEQYLLTLSDGEEHLALRVEPLPSESRLIGNRYLANPGYGLNNMFLTDWNAGDFGELDFYDIFQVFYGDTYQKQFPYVMNTDLSVGAEYRIPAEELEQVVMSHVPVTKQELRERLRYDAKEQCYLYRPRGYHEFDYPDIPYPEVISCETNPDGSVTLLVNAVYPSDNTSKLFSHKVTLREKDGTVLYESNELIGDEAPDTRWHADRFTDEQWKEYYGTDNQ